LKDAYGRLGQRPERASVARTGSAAESDLDRTRWIPDYVLRRRQAQVSAYGITSCVVSTAVDRGWRTDVAAAQRRRHDSQRILRVAWVSDEPLGADPVWPPTARSGR